ncbi:MAG: hypothetical protein HOP15_14205 [Planctomycetes bacterium]|nr:hypothetical protein [Planctomycetota bacterium]
MSSVLGLLGWSANSVSNLRAVREAILEKRNEEVMYHVGRPGEDHFVLRMLQAWGVDGHNSHTNVCSASAPRSGSCTIRRTLRSASSNRRR